MPGARAGHLFPQAMQACTSTGLCGRLDDLLGPGFWLIARTASDARWPVPVKTVVLDEDISDESGRLTEWFDALGAPAVLVRPDRYVFGADEPEALAAALRAKFRGEPLQ